MRLWERICKKICKDLQDLGRGFARICEALGEDSHETLERIHKDSQDFGRDLQVFMRLWERICKDS